MFKKILTAAMALSLAVMCLASCGDDASSADSSASSAPESTSQTDSSGSGDGSSDDGSTAQNGDGKYGTDKFPVSETALKESDLPTENMLGRSVLNKGDQARLAAMIKKGQALDIKADDAQTIAFIGGSITQGSSASGNNQYVNAVGQWWHDNVTRKSIVVNAGIGATDSYIGVHRVDRDVLSYNPDVIFIEFSVNDVDPVINEKSYDSLIRKCMSQENNPAVVLIIMTQDNGTSLQDVHEVIAKHYDLPTISYHDAVYPEVAAGTLDWKIISNDNIHPNNTGHPLLTKLITSYLEDVVANLDSIDTSSVSAFSAESETGDVYADATIGSRETPDLVKVIDEGTFTEETNFQKFTGGWETLDAGSIKFEMEFRNLGVIFYKSAKGLMGKAEVFIDGESVALLDGDFPNGWGDYAYGQEIYTSDAKAKHTVEVKVDEADVVDFRILDWLIS